MDESESDVSIGDWDVQSTDSEDRDLRERFARGELKSGHIYKQMLNEDTTPDYAKAINNIAGIKKSLASLKDGYSQQWLERMGVNVPLVAVQDSEEKEAKPGAVDVHDDFNRELSFYQQAQSGVLESYRKLKSMDVAIERPDDYFAEMLKSEAHMHRIREKLVTQEKKEEMREKARKDRENRKKIKADRKLGKNKLKSGKASAFISAGDEPDVVSEKGAKKRKSQDSNPNVPKKKQKISDHNKTANKKRDWKNKKFGFGGVKTRDRKKNSAQSSADMSGFKSARNSKAVVKRAKGNMNKRPGKLRRKQMRNKRRR